MREQQGISSGKKMESARLRNEDFRRLLSTPRAERTSTSFNSSTTTLEHHNKLAPEGPAFKAPKPAGGPKKQWKKPYKPHVATKEKVVPEKTEVDEIVEESEAHLKEILSKYRDRAAERRKGGEQEDLDEADIRMKLAGGFKAVPRTTAAALSAAERRKLAIEESKYLGGDIEHTHLVKGLDYSLLNKVRSENKTKEEEEEEEEKAKQNAEMKVIQAPEKYTDNRMAKSVIKTLFHTALPTKNDYFQRGRMAYVVELEDEEAEVPTTLIRSVHDCPEEKNADNMNTDKLLIEKLTQVLSYLRSDSKKRKKPEVDNIAPTKNEAANQNIYENVGEYVPTKSEKKKEPREKDREREREKEKDRKDDRGRDRERDRRSEKEKPSSYFDERRHDKDREREREKERDRRSREDRKRKEEEESTSSRKRESAAKPIQSESEAAKKKRRVDEDDAYAELYPMGMGMIEAGGDSDEEVDYSKMDLGNRNKGLVKRWDFETAEDYEKYQSGREALPKAAFQYGVKAAGGRKTRKTEGSKKQQEQKIDRELQKIEKIWKNRESGGGGGQGIKY